MKLDFIQTSNFQVSRLDRGLRRNKTVRLFFGPHLQIGDPKDAIWLGWGRKNSGKRAMRLASARGARFLLLEDGFLRSVDNGPNAIGASLVYDDVGIYYDATQPSRLERLIPTPLSDEQQARTYSLIQKWKQGRVSKYNGLREFEGELPNKYVLVVDQTHGDSSVKYGMASSESFKKMLDTALNAYQDSAILVKTHPDVMSGKKKGYLTRTTYSNNPRVKIISENVHPVRLIERAEAIFCVTSQMGFEGLLWGKTVHVFGMPFYAGWGLTTDYCAVPERRSEKASLTQLAHAALVKYSTYVDPNSGKSWEIEDALAYMSLQREMRQRFPARLVAYDFSAWKKPFVKSFLQGSHVTFSTSAKPLRADGVVVWGSRPVPRGTEENATIIRLEDGFVRSVGLGADLVSPISWVADSEAIYYDATRISRLERILHETSFTEELLSRARKLRRRILERGVTKYNLGGGKWQPPANVQKVILVPGQVESDASITFGAPEGVCSVRGNIELLKAVRASNPHAYVVYKPHPDVLAGLRLAGVDERTAADWCDEQVSHVSMDDMLNSVDEVHVLTSLSGFEALLRNRKVVCYGQPFYSGWGLTEDIVPVSRRNRALSLDELTAGVLLLYPSYVSRHTSTYISAETAVDELERWQDERVLHNRLVSRAMRWILRRSAR